MWIEDRVLFMLRLVGWWYQAPIAQVASLPIVPSVWLYSLMPPDADSPHPSHTPTTLPPPTPIYSLSMLAALPISRPARRIAWPL
ncbi:hypothetical protein LBMAG48_18160 [Phycisphaerae bacterium]|nr:hypothetical protein LBMAG48_18160 [Phycisphaerae bacterium]